MNLGNCAFCKHWKRVTNKQGVCTNSQVFQEVHAHILDKEYIQTRPLMTEADDGCKHFEKR